MADNFEIENLLDKNISWEIIEEKELNESATVMNDTADRLGEDFPDSILPPSAFSHLLSISNEDIFIIIIIPTMVFVAAGLAIFSSRIVAEMRSQMTGSIVVSPTIPNAPLAVVENAYPNPVQLVLSVYEKAIPISKEVGHLFVAAAQDPVMTISNAVSSFNATKTLIDLNDARNTASNFAMTWIQRTRYLRVFNSK
jgi:hypothetical protein